MVGELHSYQLTLARTHDNHYFAAYLHYYVHINLILTTYYKTMQCMFNKFISWSLPLIMNNHWLYSLIIQVHTVWFKKKKLTLASWNENYYYVSFWWMNSRVQINKSTPWHSLSLIGDIVPCNLKKSCSSKGFVVSATSMRSSSSESDIGPFQSIP